MEQRPVTDVKNANLQQYRHNSGFAFACLRIFRDWCCVTPKKRATWCQTRNFSNEALETVCNFVTDAIKKLHPDAAIERAMFRRDTKAAEKCVTQLFLEEFSDGLSVYSGSHHVGYVRLSDRQKIRPPDVKGFITPPKYALFFKIRGGCTSEKTRHSATRKCTLYLMEVIVMEHVKKSENPDFTKHMIDNLFNKILVAEVRDICPGIMTKLFGTHKRVCEFTEKVKFELETKVVDLYIDANLDENFLTIHTSHAPSREKVVVDKIKKVINQEKEKIMSEVASFEYPRPGSGMTLHVLNNGKVKDIHERSGEPSSDSRCTLLIYVCCCSPKSLRIFETLHRYGEVLQLMSDEEAEISKSEPRLWGKIHCQTDEQKQKLLGRSDYAVVGWDLFRHIHLKSARPDLRADSKSVEFFRVSVRSIATALNQVTIHRNGNSWTPSTKYVVVGKDPCKVWWFNNGDGAFKPNHKYVSNQKIIRAVKDAFGSSFTHNQLTIDRSAELSDHECFAREKQIVDHFIGSVPDMIAHFDVTLNGISKDNVYHTDFIDFFDKGKEFLVQYKKAREEKTARFVKKQFWIHSSEHYSAMVVKPEVFECVKGGIDVVCQTAAKNKLGVSVDASTTKSNMVLIQVHGRDKYEVKRVSNVVKKVISPEIIKQEDENGQNGRYLFPYLTSCGGKNLIEKIERSLYVKFLIQPSEDQFYIYGPPECKKEAKQRILSVVYRVPQPVAIAPPTEELNVSLLKYVMKLYGRDLSELCRQTGIKSIYWDSKLGCFTAWGNPRSIEACKMKLTNASDFVKSLTKTESDRPTCVACLCPIEGFPFKLSLCGHIYCDSCINIHVKLAVKDRYLPIQCVAEGCKEIIILNDIGRSCNYSKEGLRQVLDASVSLFIAQSGESCPVRYCVTPECPGLYFTSKDLHTGREIYCGTCGTSICNNCHVSPYHNGYTCALWKCKEHLDEDTARWFSEDEIMRRMCPRCGVGIEKIDGCSNVYCTNCKASICYQCMKHFDDSSMCYTHLDEAHGGY